VSNLDPFGQFSSGGPPVRRRDLRERSTGRSRRAARRRASADRRQRGAAVSPVAARSGSTHPPRTTVRKRIAKALVSVMALALAAAFAIATAGSPLLFSSASASASATSSVSSEKPTSTIDVQHISASADTTPISRDSVQALSARELYDLQTGDVGYTVNNSGPIRWPFNSAVPVVSPFGPRVAPCRGCSTFHNGTDFGTGDKAPIYAVAAGTVSASEMDGSFGQYISVDSVVAGHAFTAIYAHMTAGSETVQVGDTVTEGEPLGLTGCTGECTGAHLDFEININGVPVDSFVWLKANTAH
jgi:murein DD-endopeptidase MepM/ murein hydrolase activator NlpD